MAAPASAAASAQDAADLLVVIVRLDNIQDDDTLVLRAFNQLDTNPFAWHESATSNDLDEGDALDFDSALKSLLVLCNAHMALRFENQLAVYSAGLGTSDLLYSSIDAQQASQKRTVGAVLPLPDVTEEASDSNSYQTFRIVDEAVTKGIRKLQDQESIDAGLQDKPVAFANALSKALCHINRLSKDETLPPMKARILVLSVSGEASTQYIAIMNCIFAAQKASIPIDVCKIYGEDTVFLQQASHLTKASYYRLERRSGLLQYLLMAFLPGVAVRKLLHLPGQEQIDLRAACFCHKKIVDIGYVCSICLSIFCSPIPVCRTCRTKFPIASLRSLMGSGGASFGAAAAGGASAAAAKKRKLPAGTQPNGSPASRQRVGSAAPDSTPGTPSAYFTHT